MEYKIKEINVSDILANFYQPRERFDKEGIQELSESILSNGLINPITVKEYKNGKYMIVSGERRWRAHKVAGLKTIPCFVKEYKNDGQFMIDSLIENIHREDLSPTEKGKFCLEIKKKMNLKNNEQVANVISVNSSDVCNWVDDFNFRKSLPVRKDNKEVPHKMIRSTKDFPDKERKEIIKFAEKEGKSGSFIEEDFIPIYKKSDEPTKKALLSGRVTIEDVKRESIPEPIKLEETANNVVNTIISNLHDFKYNVDILLKEMNIEDLSKLNANKAMTTAGLHIKVFKDFVNALRKRGATPHPLILDLIKANGKI